MSTQVQPLTVVDERTDRQRKEALEAFAASVRDGVREGLARTAVSPQAKARQPGDKFTVCEYCEKVVHYAVDPDVCARPYTPCNNNCPAGRPKAIHNSCIEEITRKLRTEFLVQGDDGPVGFECDVCRGKFEVDVEVSTRNMLLNLCCNMTALVVLILILAFLSTGIAWQYFQFRAIVKGTVPPDPINNPSLVYLNKTSHTEMVRRPVWSEFRSYNHCVPTEAAERIIRQQWLIMTEDENDDQDIKKKYAPMGIEERLTAMYALLKENGDPESLSKYYWMCGGVGWLGRISDYIETCFYATGYVWYVAIVTGVIALFLRCFDKCFCDGGMLSALHRSRGRAVVRVGGRRVRHVTRPSSGPRKTGLRSIHKS